MTHKGGPWGHVVARPQHNLITGWRPQFEIDNRAWRGEVVQSDASGPPSVDVPALGPANGYVRSGHHAKAAYWFRRTLAILDRDRIPRRRSKCIETNYLFEALFVLIVVWIAKG